MSTQIRRSNLCPPNQILPMGRPLQQEPTLEVGIALSRKLMFVVKAADVMNVTLQLTCSVIAIP